jgi:uncharacterized membrane-anchored protein YhcB (DUF1043 family)
MIQLICLIIGIAIGAVVGWRFGNSNNVINNLIAERVDLRRGL